MNKSKDTTILSWDSIILKHQPKNMFHVNPVLRRYILYTYEHAKVTTWTKVWAESDGSRSVGQGNPMITIPIANAA